MAVISFLISIHHTDTVKAKIGHSSFAFVYHVHLNIPSAWHNDFNKWSNNETYLPILAAVSSYEPQNVTALSSFPMSQVTFDPPVTKALWPGARITIDRRGGKGPTQVSLNNSTIKPSCREKCLVFMWFFFQSLNVSLFIRMQHIPAHLSWARMERARSEKTKGGGSSDETESKDHASKSQKMHVLTTQHSACMYSHPSFLQIFYYFVTREIWKQLLRFSFTKEHEFHNSAFSFLQTWPLFCQT